MTIDWHEAFTVVANADRSLLAGAFLASVGTVLISARKWQLLLQRARIGVGFPAAAQLYWIGAFFSNFMPTGIGGDAVRLMMTPAPDGRARVAATILIERLTGLLVMLGLSAFGLLILPLDLGGPVPRYVTIAGVAGLAMAVTAVLFMPAQFLRMLEIVQPYLPRLRSDTFRFCASDRRERDRPRMQRGRGLGRPALLAALLWRDDARPVLHAAGGRS